MLILNWPVGLGNQLSIYAWYLKLKSQGYDVKLDRPEIDRNWYYSNPKNPFHLNMEMLDVPLDFCTWEERKCIHKRPTTLKGIVFDILKREGPANLNYLTEDTDWENVPKDTNAIVWGVFDPNWTVDYFDEMRSKIKWYPPQNSKNIELAKQISDSPSCSIHFRRTDYLFPENAHLNIMTEDYYTWAISYIREKVPGVKFFVFSDDTEWAKENYGSNDDFTIIDWNDGEDGVYDLWLMTLCQHDIMAHSSFSAWGSILSKRENKICIRPYSNNRPWAEYMKKLEWILYNTDTGEILSNLQGDRNERV